LLPPMLWTAPLLSLNTASAVKELLEPRAPFLHSAPSHSRPSTPTPPPSRSLASHPKPATESVSVPPKSKTSTASDSTSPVSAASMRIPSFWFGSLHPPPPPPSVGPAKAHRHPSECRRYRRTLPSFRRHRRPARSVSHVTFLLARRTRH
jgi:hypothetical protein